MFKYIIKINNTRYLIITQKCEQFESNYLFHKNAIEGKKFEIKN